MMQLHLTIPVFICLAASCYCQPAHYYGHGLPRVKQTVFTDQMKGRQNSQQQDAKIGFVMVLFLVWY